MAPVKRPYWADADAYLLPTPTSVNELSLPPLSIEIDNSVAAKLALCPSPQTKKLRTDGPDSWDSPGGLTSLSDFLGYQVGYDIEPDALVPSSSDEELVTGPRGSDFQAAWIAGGGALLGGGAALVPSFDGDLSPLEYPADPDSGSFFSEEDFERAFDAALLDDGQRLRNDEILLTVDAEGSGEATHAVPRPPPPSRVATPSPGDMQEGNGNSVNTVAGPPSILAAPAALKKGMPGKPAVTKPKGMTKKAAANAARAAKAAKMVVKAAEMEADGVDSSDKSESDRWIHNTIERKRRGDVRKRFDDLRDLFPDLAGDDRTASITTLTHAIAHIAEMQRLDGVQENELRLLRERNAFLKAQATARQQFEQQQQQQQLSAAHLLGGRMQLDSLAWEELQQQLLEQQQADAALRIVALPTVPAANGPPPTEVVPLEPGAPPLAADPTLRARLPPALRVLLDHNSRGTAEVLPPRRPKARTSAVV